MLRIGKFFFFFFSVLVFESVYQPPSLPADLIFSAFSKDTLCVVKTANFIPTGKYARGKPRMRWVEGMYNTWMEGGRLEGSA
jgi:hypothetical protein